MAEHNMNDSVGKKIVEALKMQTHDDEQDSAVAVENSYDSLQDDSFGFDNDDSDFGVYTQEQPSPVQYNTYQTQSSVENAFQQSIARNLGADAYAQVPDDFDYPANVAVLRQLIAKLPSGVSKQTGATIIRQTMEALGISMPSVIQEAKQVQETLVSNSKECQANIIEYRKQIGILEAKSQQYQRQSAVMNDIINLFIKS